MILYTPDLTIARAVLVNPGIFGSHHEISAIAAIAKHQAKRMPGNSLFIERREQYSPQIDLIGSV